MSLETLLHAQLAATSALTDAVSTRIYRYQRARGSALPAVTFQRFTTTPSNHATGTTVTTNARIQVDSWAADMDTARTVSDAVATALNGWSSTGTTPSITMVHLISDLDLSAPPEQGDDVLMYRITQDYDIWYA